MRNIIVTGGAGYIGSHTCKKLIEAGYNPIVIDNLSTGHKSSLLWGNFEFGDLNNIEFIINVMKKYKPYGIIHFAASSLVGESNVNPEKYYSNNVCNSLNLLKAMLHCKVNKIVFSSTCAIFGIPDKGKSIDEEMSKNPISTYGKTKLMIENILDDFDKAYGINSICLRYFNACGATPNAEIGENHNPETHLVPIAINTALGLQNNIKIFGNDFNTKDGTCVRDYIHVDDIADAHIKSLKYLTNNCSDKFNLGIGKGFSVKDIIKTVEQLLDKKINVLITERRQGDPDILISNNKKIKDKLDWNPKYEDINKIILTAITWHKKLVKNV